MKKIQKTKFHPNDTFSRKLAKLQRTSNQLVSQHNEMISEIRDIKTKHRLSGRFHK